MPELPEVELIRRDLRPKIVGRVITSFESPWLERYNGHEAVGTSVRELNRRGKYLLATLSNAKELLLHLGMTGSLAKLQDPSDDPHVRARLGLDDGVLELRDARRFGRLTVVTPGGYTGTLARLGRDPLADALDVEQLHLQFAGSRSPLKALLLSQQLIAGVGNYMADEIAWEARLHPLTKSLSIGDVDRLVKATSAVIERSLRNGGTTLRDYKRLDGSAGSNQDDLRCYGRAGLPCLRCAELLIGTVIAGRGTTYCPRCQQV